MNDLTDWQPACTVGLLRQRAKMLQNIRQFFFDRGVLEVETPILSMAIGTDPQLDFFSTTYHLQPTQQTLFLQTSPEFAMKRLLAAGSGSIFQICKAFRNGESGRFHNPEFTLLEWYRIGFDLTQLMAEVADLIIFLFGRDVLQDVQTVSYQQVFQQYTDLNCLEFCGKTYSAFAERIGLNEAAMLCGDDHGLWLDLLFSHCVQPQLGKNALCMVYGYPACQSSLAKVSAENSLLTERVELFINGVELGNGYYELCDVKEQEARFDKEIALRQKQQDPIVSKDKRLLAALTAGLPDCSGIAIGLDRLLMLLSNSSAIDQVLAFPISKA